MPGADKGRLATCGPAPVTDRLWGAGESAPDDLDERGLFAKRRQITVCAGELG
jgi:hypothetical protein